MSRSPNFTPNTWVLAHFSCHSYQYIFRLTFLSGASTRVWAAVVHLTAKQTWNWSLVCDLQHCSSFDTHQIHFSGNGKDLEEISELQMRGHTAGLKLLSLNILNFRSGFQPKQTVKVGFAVVNVSWAASCISYKNIRNFTKAAALEKVFCYPPD